jgi:hypothetical protein
LFFVVFSGLFFAFRRQGAAFRVSLFPAERFLSPAPLSSALPPALAGFGGAPPFFPAAGLGLETFLNDIYFSAMLLSG